MKTALVGLLVLLVAGLAVWMQSEPIEELADLQDGVDGSVVESLRSDPVTGLAEPTAERREPAVPAAAPVAAVPAKGLTKQATVTLGVWPLPRAGPWWRAGPGQA